MIRAQGHSVKESYYLKVMSKFNKDISFVYAYYVLTPKKNRNDGKSLSKQISNADDEVDN